MLEQWATAERLTLVVTDPSKENRGLEVRLFNFIFLNGAYITPCTSNKMQNVLAKKKGGVECKIQHLMLKWIR